MGITRSTENQEVCENCGKSPVFPGFPLCVGCLDKLRVSGVREKYGADVLPPTEKNPLPQTRFDLARLVIQMQPVPENIRALAGAIDEFEVRPGPEKFIGAEEHAVDLATWFGTGFLFVLNVRTSLGKVGARCLPYYIAEQHGIDEQKEQEVLRKVQEWHTQQEEKATVLDTNLTDLVLGSRELFDYLRDIITSD